MECRLERSAKPWQSQVLLRMNDQPEVTFGPIISDPDELEDRLRRAQCAVLNPNIVPDTYCSTLKLETYHRPLFHSHRM